MVSQFQNVPFNPISALALPARWNTLEVIFHRGGMRSLFLWGQTQILILEIFSYIHLEGTYFVAPEVKFSSSLNLDKIEHFETGSYYK
jgi:hypothetical protein